MTEKLCQCSVCRCTRTTDIHKTIDAEIREAEILESLPFNVIDTLLTALDWYEDDRAEFAKYEKEYEEDDEYEALFDRIEAAREALTGNN
jgi:hypothetical protein